MVMVQEGGMREERRIDAAMQLPLLLEIRLFGESPAEEMTYKSKGLYSVDS